MAALAALALVCALSTAARAQQAVCGALNAKATTARLNAVGAQLASYACSAERGDATEVVSQAAEAAASVAAASAAGCDVGVTVDRAGDAGMAMSTMLTDIVTTSYSDNQICECASGAGVVQFPAESLMSQALQSVKSEDVSGLDTAAQARQYSQELAASLAPGFSSIVESLTVFADDNCRPGSGGVLDQSFACGELQAGNETELAYATGREAAQFACGPTETNGSYIYPTPKTIVQSFSKAVAHAVDEAERICTIGDSRVECSLTDEQVRHVALAQLSGLSRELSSLQDTCGCNITYANLTNAEPLAAIVMNNTAFVHAEGCRYGTLQPEETALALNTRLEGPLAAELLRVIAESDCPGSPNLPWELCGNGEGPNFAPPFAGCCTQGFQCVTKNAFYAQCREVARDIPVGWNGTIIDCARSQ